MSRDLAQRSHLYAREQFIIEHADKFIQRRDEVSMQELLFEYDNLLIHYKNLLAEVRLMTRVNDKMHNKLHLAHDSLKQKTGELQDAHQIIAQTNTELEKTNVRLEQMVYERTQDLNQAYNDLLASNKELDLFVYRASHDIRGPLATLLGLSYLAKLEIKDTKAIGFFERIEKIAQKTDHILSHLLSINKMKNAKVRLELLQTDEIFTNILNEIEAIDKFRGVQIWSNIPSAISLSTDIELFNTLVTGVLEHAVESLKDERSIHLEAYTHEDNLAIRVIWKGVVVPEEYSDKIFEMFYRIDNHEDLTGLKLYCAKQAVEKLNGTIQLVESIPERTIIEIKLPWHRQAFSS